MKVVGKLSGYQDVTIFFANGDCQGGALSVLCACDLRFCVPDARFSTPSGLFNRPYLPKALQVIQRAIGLSRTQALIYLAQEIPASLAVVIGLIHETAQNFEEVLSRISRIQNGFDAIRLMKKHSLFWIMP